MRLLKTGTTRELVFDVPTTVKKVGIAQVKFDDHFSFADSGTAVSGPETFTINRCETREQFVETFNIKSKYLHLYVEDEKFRLQDLSNKLAAAPEGIYENTSGTKYYLKKQSNGEYSFRDSPSYVWGSTSTNFVFRGGLRRDLTGSMALVGTATVNTMLQSKSLALGGDLAFDSNRYYSSKTRGRLLSYWRSSQFHDVCTLEKNGRVVYPQLFPGDTVDISCVGINNGLLLRSPVFGFIPENLASMQQDIYGIADCAFNLRANEIYKQSHITVVTAIPIDTKTLRVTVEADLKPTFACIRKDGTVVNVFRGPVLTNSRFFISDQQQVFPKFELGDFIQRAAETSREGDLVFAISTPALNSFNIMESPKIDLSVNSNVLICNGVNTGLAIAQGTVYTISVQKGSNLTVTTQTGNASVLTSTEVAPAYSYTTALDGLVTWKSGIELGPFCYGVGHERMYQIVRAELNGSDFSKNLAAYDTTDGTFGSYNATFTVAESEILTVSGVAYTRLPYLISKQVSSIIRNKNREITGDFQATRRTYKKRVKGLNVYISGGDLTGYNDTSLAATLGSDMKIDETIYHKFTGSKLIATYTFLDAQNNYENGTLLPDDENWSVTISTLP